MMERDFTKEYRPRTWDRVIGQKNVVKVLSTSKDYRVILLSGPPGTGKTTIARIYAADVNCPQGGVQVCGGNCPVCSSVFERRNIDVLEENVGDNRKLEDVQKIVEWIKVRPFYLAKKVLIMDECHMLTNASQNLLLKVLEEPPSDVYIILCTTNPSLLIEPLRQRCFRFDLEPVSPQDLLDLFAYVIEREIEKGNSNLSRDLLLNPDFLASIDRIIRASEGIPRKFLRLLQVFLYGGVDEEIDTDKVREEELNRLFREILDGGIVRQDVRDRVMNVLQFGVEKVYTSFVYWMLNRIYKAQNLRQLVYNTLLLEEFGRVYIPKISDRDLLLFKFVYVGLKAIELREKVG